MILFRVFIKNKEVINRVYWGDGPDDAGIEGYKADIAKNRTSSLATPGLVQMRFE